MNPTPAGWPRLSPGLICDDPKAEIEFLIRAFGFEARIIVEEGGVVHHSELVYGEALVMVGGARRERSASPRSVGGKNTQSCFLYVDDVDAHYVRARAEGATILTELADVDYGPEHWADRGYECLDPEGHRWFFATRLRG